eukprot:scaffold15599_cov129-Skeletonema_dohrnii-CCMP3373.AAC.7
MAIRRVEYVTVSKMQEREESYYLHVISPISVRSSSCAWRRDRVGHEVSSEKVAVALWARVGDTFELRLSQVNDTLMTQPNLIGNFAKNPTWMLVNTKG